jgi:hypothetical protein
MTDDSANMSDANDTDDNDTDDNDTGAPSGSRRRTSTVGARRRRDTASAARRRRGGGAITGDPRAVNLVGEKFNILALGTLQFLSIGPSSSSRSSDSPLLELRGTVRRADRCTHTYVRNMTLAGAWIREGTTFSEVGLRAVHGVQGSKQLQIGFDGNWQTAGNTTAYGIVTAVSEEEVVMKVNDLKITTSLGHGHHMTNWLDLDVAGLCALSEKFAIGGLLGTDDHTLAATMPEDCKAHHKLADGSTAGAMSFASSARVHDVCKVEHQSDDQSSDQSE